MKRVFAARVPVSCAVLLAASSFPVRSQVFVPKDPNPRALPLNEIRLPAGFAISLVSDELPGARQMAIGDSGTIFVGTRGQGRVYAARDEDGDGVAERVRTILTGLRSPNGVAVRDGALYVAEISRVSRYDAIESRLDDPPAPVVVRGDLPDDEWHGWKFIAFGPDGWLYVPVGAPCNACLREDSRYASILRMKPDGASLEVFARGVRNTVGFDWHPTTRELWFTDNGRDELGNDLPPDELNRAPRSGLHFGFPHCHGAAIRDPDFAGAHDCAEFVAPARELGAHVATLGMSFYAGTHFPEEHRPYVYIPEHGSWNRSTANGYRISRVRVEGGRATSYETFAEGWLRPGGKEAWGRPVHVLETKEGDFLVSDDRAGAVYRIRWTGAAPDSSGR